MNKNNLFFAKVKPNAIIPSKRDEDAGYDIYPCFEENYLIIKKNETILIPTGIASVIDSSKYIQIQEKGSTGSIGMKYGAGVIDSGYRGEWFIAITNCNNRSIVINKETITKKEIVRRETKDKRFFERLKIRKSFMREPIFYPYKKGIAQAIVHDVMKMNVSEISYDKLLEFKSERGANKLGSSKK